MKYLMGIDIGTSSCKVALFDEDGSVVYAVTSEYSLYYPQEGYVEQDPNEWWDVASASILKCINESNVEAGSIAGVGIAGQSWSAIAIDKNGDVLINTPIWMDYRSESICKELGSQIGEDRIFEISGNPLQAPYSTGKILWYKTTDIHSKIDKILQSNSFIAYKLTDAISQDKSQGYGFHFFDMRSGEWNLEMCELMGIDINLLPKIYECSDIIGYVTEQASAITGLAIGTPVVAGGLDAACGTLGAGVIVAGETQEQGGQAGGMSICLDKYLADPRLILSMHVVPNMWLLQGGTTGGGGVMRWFEAELGSRLEAKNLGISSFDLLNDIARVVAPASDGMTFLPYMAGERSPIWNPHAKGVFYGLDFSKTKGHMVRAAMEGVAYSLRHNLEVAEQIGATVTTLRAMGGSANSLLWTQIKSDVTQKDIVVPVSDSATTLGAAILAGVGVGVYQDFEQAVARTVKVVRNHKPNVEHQEIYDNGYNQYLCLYSSLEGIMQKNC